MSGRGIIGVKIRMDLLIDLVGLVGLFLLLSGQQERMLQPGDRNEDITRTDLVVLAEEEDPYAPLADEIALNEGAMRIFDFDALRSIDPKYVIFVASPVTLSEEKLLALSILSVETGRYPAIGIISGSTMVLARDLWLRGREAKAGVGIAASAVDVHAPLDEAEIRYLADDPPRTVPLTKGNLLEALAAADYLYWARHVSPTKWFWYEGEYPEEFLFGVITVLNLFNAQSSPAGFWPLNYNPVRMAAAVVIVELLVFLHAYSTFSWRKKNASSHKTG